MTNTIALLRRHRALLVLFLCALILRVIFVVILDPSPDVSGGDANWYMQNGRQLMTTGKTQGPLQTAPLYPVFVGTVQVLIPGWSESGAYYTFAEMQVVRLIQSVLGASLCVFITLWGRRLLSARAGWIAGIALALNPALIIEASNPSTESIFLWCVFGGLTLYALVQDRLTLRTIAAVGALFGLATLTRAVFLLFPLGIALHLFLTHRERWGRLAAALLITYGAVISTWTVYNLIVWERLVIGGEGIISFVYQGAENEGSPDEIDDILGVQDQDDRAEKMKAAIRDNIFGDPVGWALHRVKNLVKATLQPHNTNYFAGESIRFAARGWVRDDRTLDGLRDLTQIDAFWQKLAIYGFHFSALALGALGMVLQWRRWRDLLPLYGMIIYFTGIHLLLLALPRYLFPMLPAYTLFAAGAVAAVWERLRAQSAPGDSTS
ncbi:MAG: glycosyltransferase family 39 protein [Anaerolineae bacterium]|nr:glycosyltransferase family 39 protein [Anaerolineae bacterium]